VIPSDRWIASLLIACAIGLAWVALIDDSPSTGVAAAIIGAVALAYLPKRGL
jgi:predicted small integral membrane protein